MSKGPLNGIGTNNPVLEEIVVSGKGSQRRTYRWYDAPQHYMTGQEREDYALEGNTRCFDALTASARKIIDAWKPSFELTYTDRKGFLRHPYMVGTRHNTETGNETPFGCIYHSYFSGDERRNGRRVPVFHIVVLPQLRQGGLGSEFLGTYTGIAERKYDGVLCEFDNDEIHKRTGSLEFFAKNGFEVALDRGGSVYIARLMFR